MDTAASAVSADPVCDNVVALTDDIMRDGPAAQTELERKRKIMLRAFELTAGQMEHDAAQIETSAFVAEHPLKQRYEMLHTSESLRIAAGWLRGALLPPAQPLDPTQHNHQPKT